MSMKSHPSPRFQTNSVLASCNYICVANGNRLMFFFDSVSMLLLEYFAWVEKWKNVSCHKKWITIESILYKNIYIFIPRSWTIHIVISTMYINVVCTMCSVLCCLHIIHTHNSSDFHRIPFPHSAHSDGLQSSIHPLIKKTNKT